jgi:excinuclease ABC subunit A
MIKNADYIIDMGPEGGSGGGLVVAQGDPELVAHTWETTGSFTGKYLAIELARSGR